MSNPKQPSIDTRAVHHPPSTSPDPPTVTPLYQCSTFLLRDAQTGADHAAAEQPISFYTRWGNPTVQVWEKVIADLEGAERGLAFSSGMAAISTTLLSLLKPGDHVVAGSCLYSATTEIFNRDLREWGVVTDFVDTADPANFEQACRPETRLIYLETPDNPRLTLTDLKAVAATASQRNILTVADNTFASPYNQNPIALGVDVVVHSATKYLSGHSDVVAGCAATSEALAGRIWRKLKVLGGCIDPFAAWLLLRGVKTLPVRMERINRNARQIAEFLESHPAVERVYYPGLSSHPQHKLACRQMRGFGGMIGFEVRGGRDAGIRVAESTKLILLAVSLGGVETLIEHPASMTHAPLSPRENELTGISPGLLRLSVGIEDAGDIITDLDQALRR